MAWGAEIRLFNVVEWGMQPAARQERFHHGAMEAEEREDETV